VVLDGGKCSTTCLGCFTPGKEPWCTQNRRLSGPRASLEVLRLPLLGDMRHKRLVFDIFYDFFPHGMVTLTSSECMEFLWLCMYVWSHLLSETLQLPEVVICFSVAPIQSIIMEALLMCLLHVKSIGSFVWIGKNVVPCWYS